MFGERLKEVRKSKGLTMDELAEIYNRKFNSALHKGTLSKYENGKQEPMISVVHNIATLLEVSTDYLLGNVSKEVEDKKTIYSPANDTDERILRLINQSIEVKDLIEEFTQLSPEQQQTVISIARAYNAQRKVEENKQ